MSITWKNNILTVPKQEFESFNKKFVPILYDFTNKPRFNPLDKEYEQRTDVLGFGVIVAIVTFVVGFLAWFAVIVYTNLYPFFLSFQAIALFFLFPPLILLFLGPYIKKYEAISFIEVQLGSDWYYIEIQDPPSLLHERIKHEIIGENK